MLIAVVLSKVPVCVRAVVLDVFLISMPMVERDIEKFLAVTVVEEVKEMLVSHVERSVDEVIAISEVADIDSSTNDLPVAKA